jgi:putative nucleotidyltransferase with HDIG domain
MDGSPNCKVQFDKVGISNEIRKERNETISALLAALDLNAPGEYLHAERVAVYAVATGANLGMDEDALLNLRYAALLHDVGKTKLDSKVLAKVGSLTDVELDVIRRHAEFSVKLIESYEFLNLAIAGIRSHHERWNGTGYPDALKHDQIPLNAQIIGLCEAFDVMVHGASWKTAMARDIALDEIESESEHNWNPDVVEAFLKAEILIQPVGAA